MAEASSISWTDATFNPWIGCAKVSPGCAHCYAETLASGRMGLSVWGEEAPRRITADATWKKPLRWARLAREGLLPNGDPNHDGHRPRVFCASMADVFEPRYDLEAPRERLFELIADTPELDWLLLTKRPDVAKTYLVDGRRATPDEVDEGFELGWVPPLYYDGRASANRDLGPVPLPNVWLGVSIENARFTWRADVLREIPAAVRFISAEPLVGSLFTNRWGLPLPTAEDFQEMLANPSRLSDPPEIRRQIDNEILDAQASDKKRRLVLDGIDWVIVGGESGGRAARPMHPGWAREIRDACVSLGYEEDRTDTYSPYRRPALHFKQWGSYAPRGFVSGLFDIDSRPEKEVENFRMFYYGASSKSAGKTLDGVEWCEFPQMQVPA